jgi:hypothetical protein
MTGDDEAPAPERWHLAPGDTLSGHRAVCDEGGREVAIVLAMEPGDEDATRRARLIAAAPDALRVIRDILLACPLRLLPPGVADAMEELTARLEGRG